MSLAEAEPGQISREQYETEKAYRLKGNEVQRNRDLVRLRALHVKAGQFASDWLFRVGGIELGSESPVRPKVILNLADNDIDGDGVWLAAEVSKAGFLIKDGQRQGYFLPPEAA